jgi:hypothetical protein
LTRLGWPADPVLNDVAARPDMGVEVAEQR